VSPVVSQKTSKMNKLISRKSDKDMATAAMSAVAANQGQCDGLDGVVERSGPEG
jgi:hypothetical protein